MVSKKSKFVSKTDKKKSENYPIYSHQHTVNLMYAITYDSDKGSETSSMTFTDKFLLFSLKNNFILQTESGLGALTFRRSH